MTPSKTEAKNERPAESVASEAENAKLEHTDGGSTTRDDRLDAGVPMQQGDEGTTKPSGPEDALGNEPTRGDYSGRVDAGPHMRSVPLTEAEREEARKALSKEDAKAGGVAEVPTAKLVEQGAAPTA